MQNRTRKTVLLVTSDAALGARMRDTVRPALSHRTILAPDAGTALTVLRAVRVDLCVCLAPLAEQEAAALQRAAQTEAGAAAPPVIVLPARDRAGEPQAAAVADLLAALAARFPGARPAP